MKAIYLIFLLGTFCYSQSVRNIILNPTSKNYTDKVSGIVVENHLDKKKKDKSIHPLLKIPAETLSKTEGMDFSVVGRYSKNSCNFFESHSGVTFGVHEGYVYLKYYFENENGKVFEMTQTNIFQVPVDTIYRTYRFVFDNNTKEAMVIVDCKPVWRFTSINQTKIFWHQEDNVILCEGDLQFTDKPIYEKINLSFREAANGSAYVFDLCLKSDNTATLPVR